MRVLPPWGRDEIHNVLLVSFGFVHSFYFTLATSRPLSGNNWLSGAVSDPSSAIGAAATDSPGSAVKPSSHQAASCGSVGVCGRPFRPTYACPVDMFPHTPHCELVVVFERD